MDTIAIYSIYSAISCVLLALVVRTYIILRSFIKHKVNCWFCNLNSSVSYNDKITGWNCQHCDQYNGFNSDGDYNCEIPGQYINQYLGNHINQESSSTPSRNILCERCTSNFEIKVKQLADFVPVDENDYDKEVEKFSNFLEQAYPLCDQCEEISQKKINEKNAKLIGDLVYYKLKSSKNNQKIHLKYLMTNLSFKFIKYSMFILSNVLSFGFISPSSFDYLPKEHKNLLGNCYQWININQKLFIITMLCLNLLLIVNRKLQKARIALSFLFFATLIIQYYHFHNVEKYFIIITLLFSYCIYMYDLFKKEKKIKKISPKIKKNYNVVRRLHLPRLDKDVPNLDSLSIGTRENLNNSSKTNSNFLGVNPLFESYRMKNNIKPRQTLLAQPRFQFQRSSNNSNNWASTLSECGGPSQSSSQSSGIASLNDLDTLSVRSEPVYPNTRVFNQHATLERNKFLSSPRPWSPTPSQIPSSQSPPFWTNYENFNPHIIKNWNHSPQASFNSQWSPTNSPWSSSDPGSISNVSSSSPLSPYFSPSYQYVSPRETIITFLLQSRLFIFLLGLLFIYNLVDMFVSGYHSIFLPLIRLGSQGMINS